MLSKTILSIQNNCKHAHFSHWVLLPPRLHWGQLQNKKEKSVMCCVSCLLIFPQYCCSIKVMSGMLHGFQLVYI